MSQNSDFQAIFHLFVTTHDDTWRGFSLCGLPKAWERRQTAGADNPPPLPAVCSSQTTPRTYETRKKGNSINSHSKRKCTEEGGENLALDESCQIWRIQRLLPLTASGATNGTSVQPATTYDAFANSEPNAAVSPAPALESSNSNPRDGTYIAVSKPSAFVRYDTQVDGFDTAWVNAPMFLISSLTTAAAAAATARAAPEQPPQQYKQQNEDKNDQQGKEQQLDMLIAATQSCSLDVAPISIAVFIAPVSE